MDRDRVRELADAIGFAISEVVTCLDDQRADAGPTVHLMVKEAVAILEASEAVSERH